MAHEVPRHIERLDFGGPKPTSTAEALLKTVPHLLNGARNYADYIGGSYRGQNVGNGSLATDGRHYYAVYGANYKAGKDMATVCAEAVTVERAKRYGLQILSFGVDALSQPDTKTGVHLPVLLPCSRLCLDSPQALRNEVVNDDVVIIGREKDTFHHMVLNRPEVELVYDNPNEHPELASWVIDDPDYVNLLGRSLDMYRTLVSDMPEMARLSTATQVKTAWSAAVNAVAA